MDLEELTLHYYLRVFSLLILTIIVVLLFVIYSVNKKNIAHDRLIYIQKGEKITSIIENNFISLNNLDKYVYNLYFKLIYFINSYKYHYGYFEVDKRISFFNFLKIISKPTNILNKITIVEGWTEDDLNRELAKYFKDYRSIRFDEIIADTYFLYKGEKFDNFILKLQI